MKHAALIALLVSTGAIAHPGGLNGEGCHNNRKTGEYHCHRGGASVAPAPDVSRSERPGDKASPKAAPGMPTCIVGPRGGTYTITKSGRKNYKGC